MTTAPASPPAADDPADFAPLSLSPSSAPPRNRLLSLPAICVACWSLGILLSLACSRVELWLAIAGLAGAGLLRSAARRRSRGLFAWSLPAIVALAAAWASLDRAYASPSDLRRFMPPRSRLAQLIGRVDGPTRAAAPPQGTLARFSYRDPGTLFTLDVDTVVGDKAQPARGKVLVRIRPVDERPRPGERIRVTGWLSAPATPANPGEFDVRGALADAGIVGRLTVRDRDGWQSLEPPGQVDQLRATGDRFARLAADSLALGMSSAPDHAALLDALILGLRTEELTGLDDAFRRVGLAHALAISGAHLSVLLGLVWGVSRMLGLHPRRAAALVLAVLALYLFVVPQQVPIMRSAIMAATLCLARAGGRRVRAIDALAVAALVVLVWRPDDLFNAGFQLSFVVVASMILFTRNLASRLIPLSMRHERHRTLREQAAHWGADFVAANVVASGFALPLVAYHFGAVNPLGPLVSAPALPLVSAVMTLGFLKMVVGLVFPSAGILLAPVLDLPTAMLAWLVEWSAGLPGASLALIRSPSALWTAAAMALLAAWGLGLFRERRGPLAAAAALLAAVLFGPDVANALYERGLTPHPPPALRLDSFAVGDGSCFLLRLRGAGERFTLMFDCGSLENLDVAPRSVFPAMQSLGVARIDVLMVSHADLDHFCGVVDLADRIAIGRVLTTRYVLDAARAHPNSAAGALIDGLRRRGVPIEQVGRGWTERHAGATLELVWPPPDLESPRSNDTSLVLSTKAAGRRMLLNGDIQQAAMTGLFAAGQDLAADVTDLPHHGSFVEASPRWYRAVGPSIVLQSTGPVRLHPDKWAGTIDPEQVTRLITDARGMVSVAVEGDGTMKWTGFRPPSEDPAESPSDAP
ncbi:MAG: ComEC/Rec2 family competence protein [Planctomycetota bacterium]|nr:ComEC/Rec2 family competence protein [Planctomycetota bacterium]